MEEAAAACEIKMDPVYVISGISFVYNDKIEFHCEGQYIERKFLY